MGIRSTLKKAWGRLRNDGERPGATIDYWEKRVAKAGRHAVLNSHHVEGEWDAVLAHQRDVLLPLFDEHVGQVGCVLDFGCGPGRFTPTLAEVTGEAIGMDPIRRLLDEAPAHPHVRYGLLPRDGSVPLPSNSIDAIWICLVMGGLKDDEVQRAGRELARVAKSSATIFLVENVANEKDSPHWRFRTMAEYGALLGVEMETVGSYSDVGQPIGVAVGRLP